MRKVTDAGIEISCLRVVQRKHARYFGNPEKFWSDNYFELKNEIDYCFDWFRSIIERSEAEAKRLKPGASNEK